MPTIKAGENVWVCACEHIWKGASDGSRPAACPKCGDGNYIFPQYPASRVHGANYSPYTDTTQWGAIANYHMKDKAQDNFLQGRKS
jgi:hypothetical protein